jgi:hypothetical protein
MLAGIVRQAGFDLLPAAADMVITLAGGHPLLLQELARCAVEECLVRETCPPGGSESYSPAAHSTPLAGAFHALVALPERGAASCAGLSTAAGRQRTISDGDPRVDGSAWLSSMVRLLLLYRKKEPSRLVLTLDDRRNGAPPTRLA